MKQKQLLFILSIGITYLGVTGYVGGAATNNQGDRTGRNTLTCAASGCHTSSSGATTCSIEVRKKSTGATGAIVTTYQKDTMYLVTIKGTNASLSKFGFQLTAASGSTASGTFSNLPTNTISKTVGSVPIIEQTALLSKAASGNDSVTIEWQAPSTATTTFYGIINAVNGTGDETGDAVSAPASVTLQNAASVGNIENNINIIAYPNPFVNQVSIKLDNAQSGVYAVQVYDLRGRTVAERTVSVPAGNNDLNISTDRWSNGYYMIKVSKDDQSKIIPIVKQ
ncbi:MAG: T9SS type A sorting domain-containing protein [Bacteroidetes bacterium]|nr:T9SS type A sorting domain-containing protein [Bacteroidota bacterium]